MMFCLQVIFDKSFNIIIQDYKIIPFYQYFLFYLLRANVCVLHIIIFSFFIIKIQADIIKVVKLNATSEFNRYMCTLLYSFFFFSVQVMLCLHVLCKARTKRACNLFYLSMRHHKVSHDIILGAICGI